MATKATKDQASLAEIADKARAHARWARQYLSSTDVVEVAPAKLDDQGRNQVQEGPQLARSNEAVSERFDELADLVEQLANPVEVY